MQELELVCPELLASVEMKVLPPPEGVGEKAQCENWLGYLGVRHSVVNCSSITTMLVFVRLWKTEGFCSDKYLAKTLSIHRTEEKKERDGFLLFFCTCFQIVGAVLQMDLWLGLWGGPSSVPLYNGM